MTKKTSKPRGEKTHKADLSINRAHQPTELERDTEHTVRKESEQRNTREDARTDDYGASS